MLTKRKLSGTPSWPGWLDNHCTIRMKDKATTLSTQFSVKIFGEAIQVDPRPLFQRLTVTAKASQDLALVFKAMQSPTSIFNTSLLLRWPQKLLTFDEDMPIAMKKDKFLGNNTNKQQFITCSVGCLKNKTGRTFYAQVLKQYLCRSACTHILFMHAILECDTTSRLYGIGEEAALNKVITSYYFREEVTVFGTPSALKADVMAAGYNALVRLYNGKPATEPNTYLSRNILSQSPCKLTGVAEEGTVDDLLPQNWEWKESNRVLFLSELTYHQLQRTALATGNISTYWWDFPEYNTIDFVMEATYNKEIEAIS
ncbi:LOW QUALITY PROTEIN: hypothetical protein MAR_032814 [Mya arenaria]|uniref:Uncharacterized protein n=1 Tax=Mya arenaria TaxID=6604 RepID=A0ABY7G8M9_MYAAR|nr:LOW QUALITY PROTEIN: hypothetical protein MAR_032814 [Mya arenaria]